MLPRSAWAALAATCLGGVACATDGESAPAPPLIVISIDGFRYDYFGRAPTPALHRLATDGARAPLVPVFPSETFPNHYTIVTGLYPEDHGIVANNMYDAQLDARFELSDRAAVMDSRWWGGEPIWVAVEKQGRRAATFFWPGSEAEIAGVRPSFWRAFDAAVPHATRVAQVLAWLDLPPPDRPAFVTLYFSVVDRAGHDFGPDAAEVDSAVASVDRAIGSLLAGLDEREVVANVIVVSDHGMAATSAERVIVLDDYIDLATVDVVSWGPALHLRPLPGLEDSVYRALAGRHPHLAVYRTRDVPERFRYRRHHRIQPIIGLADPGWRIASRAWLAANAAAANGGTHGYDHEAPSMLALFVASGPAFRRGVVGAPFQNIHLYALMAQLLGVTPAPHAGSADSTAAFLRWGADE